MKQVIIIFLLTITLLTLGGFSTQKNCIVQVNSKNETCMKSIPKDAKIIATLYSSPNYQGSSLVLITNDKNICKTKNPYRIPDLGVFGWKDITQSAQTFSPCHYLVLYDFEGYKGIPNHCNPNCIGFRFDSSPASLKIN